MKCIILSAGYTGEAFDLANNIPRTLLSLCDGKTIMDALVDEASSITAVDTIYIVTNNRFYEAIETWKSKKRFSKNVKIVNDTTNNANEMLGAVGDILYTINAEDIRDDVFILLGDNVFDFSLQPLYTSFSETRAVTIAVKEEEDFDLLTQVGIVEMDSEGKVTHFEERPINPKSHLKSLGIYLIPTENLADIRVYLEEGNRAEKPGYLLEYLYKKIPVYAKVCEGNWFDINTEEELQKAKKIF